MVSISKNWVLLIELPFKIRELRKQGFEHFALDVVHDDSKRIELRAWRNRETPKNVKCPDCDRMFNNSVNLDAHKRSHKKKQAGRQG